MWVSEDMVGEEEFGVPLWLGVPCWYSEPGVRLCGRGGFVRYEDGDREVTVVRSRAWAHTLIRPS